MSAYRVSDIDIVSRLQKLGYFVSQPRDVAAYIADDIELVSVLEQAPDIISEVFGISKLRLYVLSDMDDRSYRQLVIKIGSNLTPRERVNRHNALIDDWLVGLSNSISSKLTISIEQAS